MREFDRDGLILCKLLGEVFSASKGRYACSSEIFIRRFMYSETAKLFDSLAALDEILSADDIFSLLDGEYEQSSYGRNKFDTEVLYWIGYMYMYGSYIYERPLKSMYRFIKPKELSSLYFAYHSLDCKQAWGRIFEAKGKGLDEQWMLKEGVRIYSELLGLTSTHFIDVDPLEFDRIVSGKKKIRIGLNDRRFAVGDKIVFEDSSTGQKATAIIKAIKEYNDFYELYDHSDKSSLGYAKGEEADPKDMQKLYSMEDIAKHGVMAISFSLSN